MSDDNVLYPGTPRPIAVILSAAEGGVEESLTTSERRIIIHYSLLIVHLGFAHCLPARLYSGTQPEHHHLNNVTHLILNSEF